MFECGICGSKHERFKTIEGLYSHLERVHSDEIPEGWSVQQYAYYIKTGKTHGRCVICKGKTKFNPATGKYYRLCGKKSCSDKNREIFKERMIGKYGKVTLLDDPEQQKKMLANRKISGTYTWSDGKKFTYTGSYELDFLKFLDVFLNFPSDDIECPSPHTYYYEYEGKKHFYIPDVYIQSLNLEIEVKDGGNNPNTHHKIQDVDKKKEALKDKVMITQNAVSYVKVTNKEYDTFFKYLYKMKDQYNDKGDEFKPIFVLGESSVFTDYSDIVLEASDEEIPDTQEYMFYVSNEPKLKTIRATNSKSVPGSDKVVIASPFKEFATAMGVNLSKDHIKMVSTFTNNNLNIEIELLDKFAPIENKFSIYVLNKEGFEPMERNGEKSKVRYVKKGDAEVIREIKVSNWRRYINRFTNVKLINFPNDEEAKEIAKKKVKEGYELVTESKEYPEELPQDIIDLSKTLNSYEYGVLINGKVKTGKDIDFTKYKTVSIKDFEKYHAGVCWDFVNYEAKWFKDHRYNFSTYYIEIDDNRNCPSHTFLIFNYKGKYYYFESSWVRYQGIEEFNSKMDAVNTVIKRHNEAFNKDNKYKIYCWEYNTAGLDSGLKTNDYMNKIYSSGREIKIRESTDIVLVTESSKSTLDNNYKPKGKKDLSSFKRVHITEMVIDKYKKEYPFLKHVRCKDTKEYICDGYIWFDNNDLVAMVGSCEYTDDKTKWVVSLEITKNYKGYGLSKQILDYAVKTMNCKYLSVNKNNKIAKKVYDDYGFKVYHEDDTMYYMTIDKNVKENLQEEYSDFDPVTEASKRKPPKIITKNLEIEKQYGVYGDGELYNAIVELKGINFKSRGRSEMLVIKDDMVYLSKSKSGELGNYSLPGGGWEPNESHDESAVRETREETRMHTKNVVYGGNYLAAYDEPNSWVKNNVEEKFQWRGYYTEVYIGEYDGIYTGHIDEVDKDDIIKTGKFYPIQEVKKLLNPIHLDIINRYLKGEIGGNLESSFTELFDEGRDATIEEEQCVTNYIDSISENTGIDFWDLLSDVTEDGIDLVTEEIETLMESKLPFKLYHGSKYLFDELRPFGIDFGNSFQDVGWSLFTWTNHKSAMGWGCWEVFRHLKKIDDNITLNGCLNSQTTVVLESVYEYLKENIHRYSKKDLTFYVYTIPTKTEYEYGLGHSSNTPNCITIRTDHIKYSKVDKYVMDMDMVDEYCKIVPDGYEPTGKEYGVNKRLTSFLMKHDFMYQPRLRKSINKAIENGDLEPGDDLSAFLKDNNIDLKSVSFKERLSDIISNEATEMELVVESDDKSKLDKDFEKKTGLKFKFIDIEKNKSQALKYLSSDKTYAKEYKKHIDNIKGELVISEKTDTLAGYVFVLDKAISPVFVFKKYRGYGLGDHLIKDAIKKYGAIELVVYKDNEVAIDLYKKNGFVIVGYGNTKDNSDYWMKLKSKLTKDDKVMNESYIRVQSTNPSDMELVAKSKGNSTSYYRVTYNGNGIYEEFKNACDFDEWKRFKKSKACNWLPLPPEYKGDYSSYFTKKGFEMFKKYTLPEIEKKLDSEKIDIERINTKLDIVYQDDYQVVSETADIITKYGTGEIPRRRNELKNYAKFNTDSLQECYQSLELSESQRRNLESSFAELLGEGRDATNEEVQCVTNYIDSISESTEIDFWDLLSDVTEDDIDLVTESTTKSESEFNKLNFKNPKELSDWMKRNIRYKNYDKLMTPEEVFDSKKGSCHDQVMFEDYFFKKMGIPHGKIFLIEYNEGEQQGGTTHSFIYYKDKNKFYWFENAWGGQEGINGPYDSLNDLKDDVKEKTLKNSRYKNVEFSTVKNVESGMSLGDFVSSCLNESVESELVTEEAIYSSTNKYPVFIVLMHSGTTLANAIKAFTKDEFSHACISFNSKLDPLYSFGNKKVNIIEPGFVIQNSKSDFYKKHKAYYNVFVMYVDKDSYKKMKERLQYFIDNKDDLKYDLASLFKIANGKPSEESKKYFCSKFCMNVIGAGRDLEKVPSLWKPEDIKGLDDISLVDKGVDFSLYDYKETEKNLEKIKKAQVGESMEVVEELYKERQTVMDDIVDFNRYMNSMEYKITYNGRPITRIKLSDFVERYRSLTPKEFFKYGGGICWDYVPYQAMYFRRNFRNVKYKTFFVAHLDSMTNPTHTFMLFYLDGKCYWFESSWKTHTGILEFNNEDEALSYIIHELYEALDVTTKNNVYGKFIVEYDALNERLFNITCEEYMQYMEDSKEYRYREYRNVTPAVIIKQTYFENGDYIEEATLSAEERDEIPSSDYGIPSLKKYPMPDEAHVRSAIKFFNYVDEEYEEILAENIKKKIKEFDMEVNIGEKNRLSKYL